MNLFAIKSKSHHQRQISMSRYRRVYLKLLNRHYQTYHDQLNDNVASAKISWLAFILLAALFTVGCGSVQFSEYPVEHQKGKCIQSNDGNIAVYAESINDKTQCQKYFGTNLLSRQILPVFVYIQNLSGEKTYLIEEGYFSLKGTSKSSLNTENEQSVVGAAVFAGILAAPIISLPVVVIVGGKAITDVARVEQNFNEKQFKRKTLSPGREAYGFVYFHCSKETPLPQNLILEVTILDIQSSEKIKHQFDLLNKENAQ